jgi:3-methyladenine DNA glycosylase/8-oxoguanine DNA glycosylase
VLSSSVAPVAGPLRRELRLERAWDLRFSLGPLRRGRLDPCVRIEGRTMWRASRTPEGPATEAITVDPCGTSVTAQAWGPGADWLLEALPDLVGDGVEAAAFDDLVRHRPASTPPGWDVVVDLARRKPGLRIPRTRAVAEECVPTILEQKVTGLEATRSYRQMVDAIGEPAPGPPLPLGLAPARTGRLMVPPSPARLAATPAWAMHPWGIERKRADTIRRVGAVAARLEEAVSMRGPDAARRLMAVPGLGPWSAATVALVALGDADAVMVGDFHLPNQVAWTLAGLPRGDDDLMLELLEPWRGHRGRVTRLLMAAGVTAPKWGPRQPIRSWRAF